MAIRVLLAVLMTALVLVSAPAGAQQEAKRHSITALALSRAVFAGIRIGAEAAQRDGNATADVVACVMGLDESGLAPTYETLMREVLSEEDIRKLDSFYGSEAGRRYHHWSINQLRAQQKLPINEPLELGPEEIGNAEAFHAAGPGLVLAGIGAPGSSSEKTLNEAITKALEPCKR